MRIGVFGGSFDPVHIGHLLIAETALETLELDQVRWIPAARSPLKPSGPRATADHRTQMLRLALAGAEHHVVDEREIHRGDVSFTFDTLTELNQEFPQATLFLIIGSDSLATFQQWHRPNELLRLAIPAVVRRGGGEAIDFAVLEGLADPDRVELARSSVVPMPLIELSSSELRERVAAGRSIRFRTPRAVEALISAEGLYQADG